jgi:prepilin-type N-terminal cleavage/methylation domain-containing protein
MKTSHVALRQLPRSGFTLLEVLVSSAVLAIIMAVLLGSVSTSLSLWRTTENKIAVDREGRSAHLLIAQDLMNAVVPDTSTNLWPQISTDGTRIGFLTLKPYDYQDTNVDFGDICYVEYALSNSTILCRVVGSKETFASIKNNSLPSNSTNALQMLADNVVPNEIALKGTPVTKTPQDLAAVRANFVAVCVSNSGTKIFYVPAGTNRPDAIEVNIATADADSVRNAAILSNTAIPLRSGGYFTFRVNLP